MPEVRNQITFSDDELNTLESLGIDLLLLAWGQRGELPKNMFAIRRALGHDAQQPYLIRQAALLGARYLELGETETQNVYHFVPTEAGVNYAKHFLVAHQALVQKALPDVLLEETNDETNEGTSSQ